MVFFPFSIGRRGGGKKREDILVSKKTNLKNVGIIREKRKKNKGEDFLNTSQNKEGAEEEEAGTWRATPVVTCYKGKEKGTSTWIEL